MRAVNLLPAPRVEQRQDRAPSRLRSTNGIAAAGGAVSSWPRRCWRSGSCRHAPT